MPSLQEMNRKRQAQGLERNLKGIIHFLEDQYTEFQQLCRVFNPRRGYSPTAAKEIKETYKMSSAKFAEARALQQLMRGKYRGYADLDPQLQRQVEELSLMFRKDYRFFEQNQNAWEREQKARGEKAIPQRLLTHVYQVYATTSPLPALLLCFQGDAASLQAVKERITLRDHDTWDTAEGELWFFVTGVEYADVSLLREQLIDRLLAGLQKKVKGIALRVSTGEQVHEDVLRVLRRDFVEVNTGDIKIL
ncbi:MAG: hypothetical protein A2Z19_06925 [Deltaproteobacteria bacterium RBG_16_54_18]|jgi:hypothetical protein|nr:MAG: hypothetical protein A2Z19_06925 [Deltaproteobacteria bacterium RBG_16_54_18]